MQHKGILLATYVLVIAGALNWGLIGILDLNVVNLLLGGSPVVEKIIYILIGASAVYDILVVRGGLKRSKRK